jgi:hypothetical protein
MPMKKRSTSNESDADQLNSKVDALNLTEPPTEHCNEPSTSADIKSESSNDTESDKIAVGLPTTVCPNSKKCFADRHPTLPTKCAKQPDVDLFEEMIVDEFSLILFGTLDDYKVLFLFKV